jgi:putative ABC transport system permease protein
MKQFFAILPLILGNIARRPGSSLVTIIGVAGVVGVLVSILAMAQGLRHTLAVTGRPDNVIILAKDATNEGGSSLPRAAVNTILDNPWIRKDAGGKPIASREMLVQLRLPARDGSLRIVSLRGVDPAAAALRPGMHLIQGRMFQPGRHELVVGSALQSRFPGLHAGGTVTMEGGAWIITGSFASSGDSHESEMLGDSETLLAAYHRSAFQSVTVALEAPAQLIRFDASLEIEPSLAVQAEREDLFYAARSQAITRVLTVVGILVGAIMAIGAVCAALNTMYAAVAAEAPLIATLRAIGFGWSPVLLAVFSEALLLALMGAVLGVSVAALLFNGHAMAVGVETQTFYTMRISPGLAVQGAVWALVIGAIGGLFPARRAALLPVAEALRDI